MAHGQLNLARKWRSQNFKEIVGQPLVVSMLQNSLYSGHIFPVYLLSGQRGCGKTSTARVFAAAVNCHKLELFKQKPKEQMLPCLECPSCLAMRAGNHPDVIEMDAASHTGVDNVRQIIEAASFMPLLGTRKVYLIDEAHMLSKAAFNALLKILEEPPASVIFLLATTDPHKIIETVTSRCFRLFFTPIDTSILENHLEKICKQEGIPYDPEGLKVIVAESEGSARDAINLLEQVRFATDVVNKKGVQCVLGHLDDERLVQLVSTVLAGDPAKLIVLLQDLSLASYSSTFVWHAIILMLRAALWHTCNVPAQLYAPEGTAIVRATGVSPAVLIRALRLLYEQERLFTKTTAQHGMLEMMLIHLCASVGNLPVASTAAMPMQSTQSVAPVVTKPVASVPVQAAQTVYSAPNIQHVPEKVEAVHVPETIRVSVQRDAGWDIFLQSLAGGGYDPLIVSIFTQGQFKVFDTNASVVQVIFPKSFEMFQDMMVGAQHMWEPLLQQAFGAKVTLQPAFSVDVQTAAQPAKTMMTIQVPQRQGQPAAPAGKPAYKPHPQAGAGQRAAQTQVKTNEQKVDVSDVEKWQKAHELVQAFDGTVTQEEDGPA